MRFLADECCDGRIVLHLRACGHDVVYLSQAEKGAQDVEVASIARDQRRILLTEDKDFGELLVRRSHATTGVVLIRKRRADIGEILGAVDAALAQHGDRLASSYCVVDGRRLRLRPLTGAGPT